jgi:hypothetical protein
MEARERRRDVYEWTPDPGATDGPGGGGLDAAREAGERFLRAGDRAIDRALSGNSEAFLRASRQEGGQ